MPTSSTSVTALAGVLHKLGGTFLARFIPGKLTRRYVKSGFQESWDLFTRVAGEIPVPGLAAALKGIDFIEELSGTYQKNLKDIEYLRDTLGTFTAILKEYGDEEKIKNELSPEDKFSPTSPLGTLDGYWGFASVLDLGDQLKKIAEEFHGRKALAVLEGKSTVGKLAELVRSMNDMIRYIMLRSLLKVDAMVMRDAENGLLAKIPRSEIAPSDSAVQKTCYAGTCKAVISSIDNWICSADPGSLYWFKGGPGSGKTTVLRQVIARHAHQESGKQLLLASFHCTRALPASCDARRIFTTLAGWLWDNNTVYRRKILKILQSMSDPAEVAIWSPRRQLKELLLGPLGEIRSEKTPDAPQSFPFPFVLMIDALEECTLQNEGRRDVQDLLDGLVEDIKDGELIKVVLSSHPLELVERKNIPLGYDMDHYLQSEDAKRDLENYYHERFKAVREEDADLRNVNWPPSDSVARLARITDGNFIVAETICGLIENADDRDQTLQEVVNTPESKFFDGQVVMKGLSIVYTRILEKAIENRTAAELENFRDAVMTIVLLKRFLSPDDLAPLLGLKNANVLRRMLRDLLPVMVVPEKTGGPQAIRVIRLRHTSFTHYMSNKEMAPPRLYIQPSAQQSIIVYHLLMFLNQRLSPISRRSEFVAKHRDREDVLEMDRKGVVRRVNRAVNYACTYWMHHIGDAGNEDSSTNSKIIIEMAKFFQPQMLLCWIAAFSHTDGKNHRSQAPKAIRTAIAWLQNIDSQQLSSASTTASKTQPQAEGFPQLLVRQLQRLTTTSNASTPVRSSEDVAALYRATLSLARDAREYLDKGDYTLGIDTDGDAQSSDAASFSGETYVGSLRARERNSVAVEIDMKMRHAREIVNDKKQPVSLRDAAQKFLVDQFK